MSAPENQNRPPFAQQPAAPSVGALGTPAEPTKPAPHVATRPATPPATAPAPTVGRIVHYVLSSGRNVGQSRAALVVRAWDDGKVNLHVYLDGSNDNDTEFGQTPALVEWATSVPYDDGTHPSFAHGSWHWPPRA